jgi:hypothetical protein
MPKMSVWEGVCFSRSNQYSINIENTSVAKPHRNTRKSFHPDNRIAQNRAKSALGHQVNDFLEFNLQHPGATSLTGYRTTILEGEAAMRLDLEEDYPAGELDEFAVCYVLQSESVWSFESVPDRSTAEHLFLEALKRNDVHKVLVDGRPSAVVWVAKCIGEDEWARIKPTKGAEKYLKTWWE